MTASQQLAALLAPANGNVTGARGTITALRENGNVNVMISGTRLIDVPCITPYVGRAVNDVVQVLQVGNTWVVIGPYGADPENSASPGVKPQTQQLFRLLDNVLSSNAPSTLGIGQAPTNSTAAPTELVLGYYTGSVNVLTQATAGHTGSPIHVTMTRSADIGNGNGAPLKLKILPHNSDAIGTTITPLTSFSSLVVNLEPGERRDVLLPTDWVSGITASTPTIRGFVIQPGGGAKEVGQDLTYSVLSKLTGGITFGQWTPYVPVWTGATTNPVIGNGSLTGRYTEIDGLVDFTAQITAGSTTTFGTGALRINYPVPPRIGSPDMVCQLRISGLTGGISLMGCATVNDSVSMNLQVPTSASNVALVGLTSAYSIAMISGTTIRVSGTYEPA